MVDCPNWSLGLIKLQDMVILYGINLANKTWFDFLTTGFTQGLVMTLKWQGFWIVFSKQRIIY